MESNASSNRVMLGRGREKLMRLREIQAKQVDILDILGPAEGARAIGKLEGEAQRLRSEWLEANQRLIARLCESGLP